jgi:serine/threonine protein kinase
MTQPILSSYDNAIIKALLLESKGYKVIKKIGSGNFSSAFLIEKNNTKFILKITDKDGGIKDNYDMFDTEIKIYEYLRKEYTDKCKELGLLCLIDNFEINHNSKKYIVTILDNYGDSDLTPLIKQKKLNLYEKELIIFHLSKNLKLLHDNEIIHKDIKPDNIRVNSASENKESNFIDYGFSCLKTLKKFKNCRDAKYGSPLYSSPELIHENNLADMFKEKFGDDVYSKSIDLWSLGILFYYLLEKDNIYIKSLEYTYDDLSRDQIAKWYNPSSTKPVLSETGLNLFKFLILSLIDNPKYRGGFFSKMFIDKKLFKQSTLISAFGQDFKINKKTIDKLFTEFNNQIKKYNLENLLIVDPEARDLKTFMLSRASWLEEVIKNESDTEYVSFENIEYKKLSEEHKNGIQDLVQEYRNEFIDNMEFTEDNVDDVLRGSKNMSRALKEINYQDQNKQFEIIKAFKDILFTQQNTGITLKEKVDIFAGKLKSIFSFTRTRPYTTFTSPETSVIDPSYLKMNPPSNAPPRLPKNRRSKKKSTLPHPPNRLAPKRTNKNTSLSQTGTYTYSQSFNKTKNLRPSPPSHSPPKFRPTPRPRPLYTYGKGKKKNTKKRNKKKKKK